MTRGDAAEMQIDIRQSGASVIMSDVSCARAARPMIAIDDDQRQRDEAGAADPALERVPAVGRASSRRDADRRAPHHRARRVVEEEHAATRIPLPPASTAPNTRRPVMKRATNTVLAPWRAKNRSNCASRARVRPMRQPWRSASRRPPRRPMKKPRLSPSVAPAIAVDDDPDQRQPAGVRERRAGEQRRLARHRQAGVLEEDADEHDGVAVAREQIEEPLGQRSAQRSALRSGPTAELEAELPVIPARAAAGPAARP